MKESQGQNRTWENPPSGIVGGLAETSQLLGAGLRPIGKLMEMPPYPTVACAPHFYPDFDGEDDHVHLLVNYPPKVSVSSLVNSLKGVSSRMIRKKNYPTIRRKLWGGALWSPSYFAGSCGGAPIAIIRQYIEQQQTPH